MTEYRKLSPFAREVLRGLSARPKSLPCKYFYDGRGSELFDEICKLDEYYPTRTELAILDAHAAEISSAIGPEAVLVEFGSGSGLKTRVLLRSLQNPVAYAPVEICSEALDASTAALRAEFPGLQVVPVHADYTEELRLQLPVGRRRVVFFPGSTIGNFTPEQAVGFLARIAALVGPGGGLVIGVDLKKDPARLHAAYNDSAGVTARFNLNLLRRVNEELDGDLDVDAFRHYAFYNPIAGRIEMHLVAQRAHRATIADATVEIAAGESIHTENSYKYTLDEFAGLAAEAGLLRRACWVDPDELFSLQHYVAAG